MRTLIDLFVSWGPMLLLIGVWIYFMRKSGSQGQYFEHVRVYMSEHVAETKRLNANLERIAAILEARVAGNKSEV
jgi:ATP-dependent Zn protease